MSENSREGKTSIFEKLVPALLVISVALSFLVGVLWQKVENINSGKTAIDTTGTTQKAPEQVKVSIDQIKGLFDKDVIKFGNKDSKLIFVEASDPSCPYCHIAAGLNSKLNNEVGSQFKLVKDGGTYVAPVAEMKKLVDSGKASFVWLYFNGHGNGELGTKAMYCAYEKGKFWEAKNAIMTDAGYTLMNTTVKNDKTQSDKVAGFLTAIVDSGFMRACLDSGKYDARLKTDSDLAISLGIQGTPSFYVNDTNFPGAYSYTDMESAVNSAK